MQPYRKTATAAWIVMLLATAGHPAVRADSDDWRRYENAHMVAYSNAGDVEALTTLIDFERFGGAVKQIFPVRNLRPMPASVVIVPGSWKEYRDLGGSPIDVDSFVQGGRPLFILPPWGRAETARGEVRRDYVATMLDFDGVDFPLWFEAAFIELASSITFADVETHFYLGPRSLRRDALDRNPSIDWDRLIRDDFRFGALPSLDLAQDAYMQAWLLLHYVLLGPSDEYRGALGEYLVAVHGGAPSSSAWQKAFGVMPSEMWAAGLQAYRSSPHFLQVAYRGDAKNESFRVTTVPRDEMERLSRFAHAHRVGLRGKPARPPLPEHLDGRWAPVGLLAQCEKPIELRYDEDAAQVTIDWDPSGEARAPTRYDVTPGKYGSLGLGKPAAAPDTWGERDLTIAWRKGDILCLSFEADAGKACRTRYERCP